MTNRETEEKLRKLAAVDLGSADANWLHYLSGEGRERQSADDLLDIELFRRINKGYGRGIFLEPPVQATCGGDYPLGTVQFPSNTSYCRFGLREEEWIKHVLITGMTGAGKTNLVFLILQELWRHNKPFIVFDWKRNYRDLRQLPLFKDCRIFTVANPVAPFRFNPLLPPPGMYAGEWLMKLVDVIKHAYFVGEGVEYLLREAIDSVFQKCGMFDERRSGVPKFHDVREFVKRKQLQGRMMLWKASALRVLESVCFPHGLGQVVNDQNEWNYQAMLAQPVILELDALSDVDKLFLTEALILWLYEYRKREGQREQFKHALVIEEGHHVLSQKKEVAEGAETIMETCLRQIREFGEAVIVIDQEPTKLSNSIKANTYSKITFNLGNGKDALEIANCMALNQEDSEAINLLDIGQAIVALKGRIQQPICVKFGKSSVRKGLILDGDIAPSS